MRRAISCAVFCSLDMRKTWAKLSQYVQSTGKSTMNSPVRSVLTGSTGIFASMAMLTSRRT